MPPLASIQELQTQLVQGKTTSVALTRAALDRIEDASGEGSKAFTKYDANQALRAAQASDLLRSAGQARSPLEGLPISVKDLFDVQGDVTTAGSVALDDQPAATKTASIVSRLINAGGILLGRTNMTEFAFSGLGINPHYGSPSSPWDRKTGRISGGSSSGAGVAVADQMSVVSLGTDTGGSVRIPSAFCGITGFKPTARRLPSDGMVPLSHSLDSSGPLSVSVDCCAVTDAILANEPIVPLMPTLPSQLTLGVPNQVILEDADEHVLAAFERALTRIQQAGAKIVSLDIPEFEQVGYINRQGGLTAAEAWAWHRPHVERAQDRYDPRVISRILRGRDMTAADYIDVLQARQAWIQAVERKLQWVDALLMPTCPIIAPPIAALEASDDVYYPTNLVILRNSSLINFLDGCALSIPCHQPGEAPVGLTIAGAAMDDRHILNTGKAIEQILKN